MSSKLVVTLGAWIVAGVVLAAADFWEAKDFTTWSNEEIQEMLDDSPWATQVDIRTGALGGVKSAISASEAGRDATTDQVSAGSFSTDDTYGGGPGALTSDFDASQAWRGGGSNRGQGPIDKMPLTISWRSALPIKLAVIRQALATDNVGGDVKIQPEQQQFLAQDEPFYIVSMTGFPPQFSTMIKSRPLMEATTLTVKKRRPIFPENIEVYLVDGTVTVLSYFSKLSPITVRDKDVEFESQVLDVKVKRKFKLKDMVFNGQLML